MKKQISTYDDVTAVCVQATTPIGEVIIYGTLRELYGRYNFRTWLRELDVDALPAPASTAPDALLDLLAGQR